MTTRLWQWWWKERLRGSQKPPSTYEKDENRTFHIYEKVIIIVTSFWIPLWYCDVRSERQFGHWTELTQLECVIFFFSVVGTVPTVYSCIFHDKVIIRILMWLTKLAVHWPFSHFNSNLWVKTNRRCHVRLMERQRSLWGSPLHVTVTTIWAQYTLHIEPIAPINASMQQNTLYIRI